MTDQQKKNRRRAWEELWAIKNIIQANEEEAATLLEAWGDKWLGNDLTGHIKPWENEK